METLLRWLHLLCMVGAFGGLLTVCFGLPPASRNSLEGARRPSRFVIWLVAAGFLLGVLLYWLQIASPPEGGLPSRFHMLIGIKFLLLGALGAFLGLASRKLKQGQIDQAVRFRAAALGTMAAAALLGTLAGS